jgi:hypothetical protein
MPEYQPIVLHNIPTAGAVVQGGSGAIVHQSLPQGPAPVVINMQPKQNPLQPGSFLGNTVDNLSGTLSGIVNRFTSNINWGTFKTDNSINPQTLMIIGGVILAAVMLSKRR